MHLVKRKKKKKKKKKKRGYMVLVKGLHVVYAKLGLVIPACTAAVVMIQHPGCISSQVGRVWHRVRQGRERAQVRILGHTQVVHATALGNTPSSSIQHGCCCGGEGLDINADAKLAA
jgi:hypothetical protein